VVKGHPIKPNLCHMRQDLSQFSVGETPGAGGCIENELVDTIHPCPR
jgi:hypothetical protein